MCEAPDQPSVGARPFRQRCLTEVMNSSSSCEQFCCATRSPELTTINELLDLPPLPQTNRGVWVDRCLEANAICLGERGNDRCRRNMRASRSLGITIRNWRIAGSRTVRLAPSPRPTPPRKTTATLLELGTRFLVVFPGGEGARKNALRWIVNACFKNNVTPFDSPVGYHCVSAESFALYRNERLASQAQFA